MYTVRHKLPATCWGTLGGTWYIVRHDRAAATRHTNKTHPIVVLLIAKHSIFISLINILYSRHGNTCDMLQQFWASLQSADVAWRLAVNEYLFDRLVQTQLKSSRLYMLNCGVQCGFSWSCCWRTASLHQHVESLRQSLYCFTEPVLYTCISTLSVFLFVVKLTLPSSFSSRANGDAQWISLSPEF